MLSANPRAGHSAQGTREAGVTFGKMVLGTFAKTKVPRPRVREPALKITVAEGDTSTPRDLTAKNQEPVLS